MIKDSNRDQSNAGQTMPNYLVITAVGKDRGGIVNELTRTITDHSCNIEDSRMTILGGEFAVILLCSGHWNEIAKLEDNLPKMGDYLELNIFAKRTEARSKQPSLLSYQVEALSIDHPGIAQQVAEFFSSRGINIQDMNTDTYHAAHTGTPMFSLNMTVNIDADDSIAQLREQFLDFCDALNLDGVFEPVRT
jgi:glycine cleavage system transcriptional repressor